MAPQRRLIRSGKSTPPMEHTSMAKDTTKAKASKAREHYFELPLVARKASRL